eukprot:4425174-Amphidinium_carterae.1
MSAPFGGVSSRISSTTRVSVSLVSFATVASFLATRVSSASTRVSKPVILPSIVFATPWMMSSRLAVKAAWIEDWIESCIDRLQPGLSFLWVPD